MTDDDPNDRDDPPFANPNGPPRVSRPAAAPSAKGKQPKKKVAGVKAKPIHAAEHPYQKPPEEREPLRAPNPEDMQRLLGETVAEAGPGEAEEEELEGELAQVVGNIQLMQTLSESGIWTLVGHVSECIETFRVNHYTKTGIVLSWSQAAHLTMQALGQVAPRLG
jgi:hypothetical protein